MTTCDPLVQNASAGVADALNAVDCMAGEATASAFARLFGTHGALLPALTILLTLYIALFAISLLTGRTRLGVAALTPRMLLLGVVLTFATSWVAYQGVLWNLAIGAPDQIAGVLMGTKGQASQIFAGRIDLLFQAIADAAESASQQQAAAAAAAMASAAGSVAAPVQQAAGTFAPASLVWLAAVLMLLGTVGLLVTARIVLAVLLALGPVFIVLGLMKGTRGLAAGWIRALALVAITPLLAVLGGGLTIELAVPVVQRLAGPEGIEARPAFALFLVAAVHCALMVLALKTAGTMVSGWRVFGLAGEPRGDAVAPSPGRAGYSAPGLAVPAAASAPRAAGTVHAAHTRVVATEAGSAQMLRARISPAPAQALLLGSKPGPMRAQGVGSRWRRPVPSAEMIK